MRLPTRLSLALAVALTLAAGCGDSDSDTDVIPATQASFLEPGPYGSATRDFVFVDSSRTTPPNRDYAGAAERRLVTRVWYPIDAQGVPAGTAAAAGPFPVIGYAHGFLSSHVEADGLKRHLASHGYIIIAPTFPLSTASAPGGPTIGDMGNQPGDLAFVIDSVASLTNDDADLAAAMDTTRKGIAGLSLGGGTVLIAVYHPVLHLPGIRAAVAHAPVSCFFAAPFYDHSLPTLIMGGDADQLVPFDGSAARALAWAPPPLTVARLIGGNHVGFLGIDIPNEPHSDSIGCIAVGNVDPESGAALLAQELTAGTTPDVVDAGGCGDNPVCGELFVQTMRGARQTELQMAATLAHFEAELRGRADAAAFRDRVFGSENADVEVTLKR